MHTCEDYVVEKLLCLEDDNDSLRFQLENAKRLNQIAEDKLNTARLAISRYIKHNEDGQIYIDSIWSDFDKDDFIRITEALDIPMSEREVTQDEDNSNNEG